MKFIVPVLAVFLCTSCLSSVIKRKGVSTDVKDKVTYDLPPIPPIPPEKYCFEQSGANAAKVELYIVGDSAHGKIDCAKANAGSGEFSGILYGSTLILNYKFKTDSGLISQEQKWRFFNDSLYRIDMDQAPDTGRINQELLLQACMPGALHKVACR